MRHKIFLDRLISTFEIMKGKIDSTSLSRISVSSFELGKNPEAKRQDTSVFFADKATDEIAQEFLVRLQEKIKFDSGDISEDEIPLFKFFKDLGIESSSGDSASSTAGSSNTSASTSARSSKTSTSSSKKSSEKSASSSSSSINKTAPTTQKKGFKECNISLSKGTLELTFRNPKVANEFIQAAIDNLKFIKDITSDLTSSSSRQFWKPFYDRSPLGMPYFMIPPDFLSFPMITNVMDTAKNFIFSKVIGLLCQLHSPSDPEDLSAITNVNFPLANNARHVMLLINIQHFFGEQYKTKEAIAKALTPNHAKISSVLNRLIELFKIIKAKDETNELPLHVLTAQDKTKEPPASVLADTASYRLNFSILFKSASIFTSRGLMFEPFSPQLMVDVGLIQDFYFEPATIPHLTKSIFTILFPDDNERRVAIKIVKLLHDKLNKASSKKSETGMVAGEAKEEQLAGKYDKFGISDDKYPDVFSIPYVELGKPKGSIFQEYFQEMLDQLTYLKDVMSNLTSEKARQFWSIQQGENGAHVLVTTCSADLKQHWLQIFQQLVTLFSSKEQPVVTHEVFKSDPSKIQFLIPITAAETLFGPNYKEVVELRKVLPDSVVVSQNSSTVSRPPRSLSDLFPVPAKPQADNADLNKQNDTGAQVGAKNPSKSAAPEQDPEEGMGFSV